MGYSGNMLVRGTTGPGGGLPAAYQGARNPERVITSQEAANSRATAKPEGIAARGTIRFDNLTGSGGAAPGIATEVSTGRTQPSQTRHIDRQTGTVTVETGATVNTRNVVNYTPHRVTTPLEDRAKALHGTNFDSIA